MAVYSICNYNFEIKNKYKYVAHVCGGYEAPEGAVPDFTIDIPKETLLKEKEARGLPLAGRVESAMVYDAICSYLSDKDCFLLHASVVALDGEGYLFTAESGTGKTTHSRLWKKLFPGAEIINGDKPIIKAENGSFYAYGTPWCGKERYNEKRSVRVKAVCFLSQAKENKIREMKTSEVVREILEQTLMPKTKKELSDVLDTLDIFVRNTQFYHLECNMKDEAAFMSYGTMKGQDL